MRRQSVGVLKDGSTSRENLLVYPRTDASDPARSTLRISILFYRQLQQNVDRNTERSDLQTITV